MSGCCEAWSSAWPRQRLAYGIVARGVLHPTAKDARVRRLPPLLLQLHHEMAERVRQLMPQQKLLHCS